MANQEYDGLAFIGRRNASTNAIEVIGVTSGAALPVTSAAGTVVTTGGTMANPSATFTRPADTTAYASGDLVANSTTAGSVVPMSITTARIATGSFMLRRVKLAKSSTGITNASFRVHLYTTSPTPSNGDNGAWLTSGVAGYIGAFDLTMDRVFTDGACGLGVPVIGSDMCTKLASGSVIYALLEARGAYTPVSAETFTVTFDDLQD